MSKSTRNPLSSLDKKLSLFLIDFIKRQKPPFHWTLSNKEAKNLRFALYTHRRLLSNLLITSFDKEKELLGQQLSSLRIKITKLGDDASIITISNHQLEASDNDAPSRYENFLPSDLSPLPSSKELLAQLTNPQTTQAKPLTAQQADQQTYQQTYQPLTNSNEPKPLASDALIKSLFGTSEE